MRLDDVEESSNVEDRRGSRMRRGGAIGGGAVVVALVLTLLGAPKEIVQQVLQGGGQSSGEVERVPVDPAQNAIYSEMRKVLTTTEKAWTGIFARKGDRYIPPKLVTFTDSVDSGCGDATSAVGPFYCPVDQQVYLDLTFFDELDKKFGAPGDFAQGYVLAHEVGHHVQKLTGISDKVQALRSRGSEVESNRLSVKMELQADCYAGIWARHGLVNEKRLDPDDIEEGLRAAASIGDDTLQKRARGHVMPESFTHGTSAQRVEWFKRGFDAGEMGACDTFKTL